jgi:hypothetical protein
MSPTLVTMSTDISASLLDFPQARKGRERSQGRPGVGLLCVVAAYLQRGRRIGPRRGSPEEVRTEERT